MTVDERGIADVVADLVAGSGHQVRSTAVWVHVTRPGQSIPDHGWKFHVSVRVADFAEVVAGLVPFLRDQGCSFKLARSIEVLGELNDGLDSPATVGKAFTIYPDQDQVGRLGLELVELLRGRRGPRVLSDRQIDPGAPVYYRYGPFRNVVVAGTDGNLRSTMVGPDGATFDGTAGLNYRQPPWVTDPFTPNLDPNLPPAAQTAETVLGNHYRPFKGLLQSARGDVYAATDIRTGAVVVVKRARAHVSESSDGVDTRMRLRNERFALTALRDVDGVVRFLDHFHHDDDEFLVTSFDGKFNLAEDVARNGRYRPLPAGDHTAGPRSLDRLAHRLARTVRDIHARGFILRDLSPKNIVIGTAGDTVTLIDFGICHHDNVAMAGGTKGFVPARQFNGEPAEAADDLHALGMTLLFAATSAQPVIVGDDMDAPRVRALQIIDRVYGERPGGLPPTIVATAALLSGNPEIANAAFTALANGEPMRGDPPQRHTPAAYRRGPDADALIDTLLTQLLSRIDEVFGESASGDFADSTVYRGSAGVGLTLLPHRHQPGVTAAIERLAEFTARTAVRVHLKPSLYLGTTGAEIFLQRTRAAGVAAPTLPPELLFPAPTWTSEGDDIIIGAAGIGLGHVLLHELDPRPEHREMVRRCLATVGRHTDPVSMFPPEDVPVAAGLDVDAGVAHGQAGVIEFLLHLTRQQPSEEHERQLATRIAWLAERVPSLIARSAEPTAVPLCTSWCRGVAGIGRVLLTAGRQRGDSSLTELAVACGHTCIDWVPYLTTAGQCCGVAGVGELFLDLAGHAPDERFIAAAESAATQLLLLGVTAPPVATGWQGPDDSSGISWASGAAGILGYLARLRDLSESGSAATPFC